MFTRRYKKCYCMNNSYTNDSCEMQNDIMEKQCDNVVSYEDAYDGCQCGFEEEEIDKIQNIDGKVVSLGPRILRTETASVVASSIVLYELSDLGGNI